VLLRLAVQQTALQPELQMLGLLLPVVRDLPSKACALFSCNSESFRMVSSSWLRALCAPA
jgi:hypothetical protein